MKEGLSYYGIIQAIQQTRDFAKRKISDNIKIIASHFWLPTDNFI